MNKRKILLYFIFISILIVSCVLGKVPRGYTADYGHLSFTSSTDSFRIFDHQTGKIYMYSSTRGELYRVYTLEELGKDLVKEDLNAFK